MDSADSPVRGYCGYPCRFGWALCNTICSAEDSAQVLPLGVSARYHPLEAELAFGTGFGLRLDIESIVIRLDLGVAIHAPFQTYKYDKKGNVTTTPINTYFNIPSALDALRLNFGIGYPF